MRRQQRPKDNRVEAVTQLRFEQLEDRLLLDGDYEFRTIDGSENHPLDWGAAETALLRIAGSAYYPGDGSGSTIIESPARANPREASNAIMDQAEASLENHRQMSDFVWTWGQFLDHDVSETPTDASNGTANISIPTGDPDFDPFFTGAVELPFSRSTFEDHGTGAREQINAITSFVDASNVYGSEDEVASALRTYVDGKLATSADGLLLPVVDGEFFAGDVRANEQSGLTAMHTLFVREHNRLADLLGADPAVDYHAYEAGMTRDEFIYQVARQIVGAEMQIITYNEFLPALVGDYAPKAADYHYSDTIDPSIATEFSTALYRVGHTMLSSDLLLVDEYGDEDSLALRDAFFDPTILGGEDLDNPVDTGYIDLLLRGFAKQHAQEVDGKVIDDVRNFLFGPPGSGGLDLPSLNIQRGRDHGLPDYNSMRVAYGLAPKTSFLETGDGYGITSDPELASQLQSVYGSLDNIDAWVGALCEDHWAGSTGELIATGIRDQFTRLRDGDRFFYIGDARLHSDLVTRVIDLECLTLAKVIENNTGIRYLQNNVFFVAPELPVETVYLSNIAPVGTPINGWGPVERDMSTGGTGEGDGGVLLLNGVSYEKGLGVHADSEIVYDLNGEFEYFYSDIGLNAGPRPNGEVIFEVYGDSALLFSSGVVTGESATQSLKIDVEGVELLRLVVDGNGSIDHDSANWADARITRSMPTIEYLSDMTPAIEPINGWGPVELDMSVGGTGQGDGGVLMLDGATYEKGLGVHADSEIVYSLGRKYKRFRSDIGLNAGPRANGSVVFEVYGDGALLYSSGLMTGESAPQSLDIDVTGIDRLRLVVDGNGSIDHDSANWAGARLLKMKSGQFMLADFDGDERVSGMDFLAWQRSFGASGSEQISGDADHDGDVDTDDLNWWQEAHGSTAATPTQPAEPNGSEAEPLAEKQPAGSDTTTSVEEEATAGERPKELVIARESALNPPPVLSQSARSNVEQEVASLVSLATGPQAVSQPEPPVDEVAELLGLPSNVFVELPSTLEAPASFSLGSSQNYIAETLVADLVAPLTPLQPGRSSVPDLSLALDSIADSSNPSAEFHAELSSALDALALERSLKTE